MVAAGDGSSVLAVMDRCWSRLRVEARLLWSWRNDKSSDRVFELGWVLERGKWEICI